MDAILLLRDHSDIFTFYVVCGEIFFIKASEQVFKYILTSDFN